MANPLLPPTHPVSNSEDPFAFLDAISSPSPSSDNESSAPASTSPPIDDPPSQPNLLYHADQLSHPRTPQTTKSFTLFRKLPAELRLRIWKLAAYRLVRMYATKRRQPVVLGVCVETREALLRYYRLEGSEGGDGESGKGGLYLSPELDVPLFNAVDMFVSHKVKAAKDESPLWMGEVETVAFCLNVWSYRQLAELYINKHSIITAGLQPSLAELYPETKELLIVLDFDTAQKYGAFSGEFEVQREMRFIRKVVEECVAGKGRVVGVRCVRVNEGL